MIIWIYLDDFYLTSKNVIFQLCLLSESCIVERAKAVDTRGLLPADPEAHPRLDGLLGARQTDPLSPVAADGVRDPAGAARRVRARSARLSAAELPARPRERGRLGLWLRAGLHALSGGTRLETQGVLSGNPRASP